MADSSRSSLPLVCPGTGVLLSRGTGSGGAVAPGHSAAPERRDQWPGKQSAAGRVGRCAKDRSHDVIHGYSQK